jgi:YbgC/YbaW family acyl-CoA thioester hydrolase
MSKHQHPIRVRWGDCDPAGIAYTAHFFDWFHQAMESWFDTVLQHPYADLILKQRVGFPTVHTEADFRLPCRLGEELVVELELGELGKSSFRLDFTVRSASSTSRLTPGPPGSVGRDSSTGNLCVESASVALRPRIKATGTTTCVVVRLGEVISKTPIPPDLRQRMAAFMQSEEPHA